MGNKNTRQRVAFIECLISQGKSRQEIANETGIRERNLLTFCHKYDVKLPPNCQQLSKIKRISRILELSQRGYSRDEIAADLGIKFPSLEEWCSRNQIPLPPRSSVKDSKKPGNIVVKTSVPKDIAAELMAEARSRNIGVVNFTSALLSCISEGKLYNAVLDQ